MNINNFCSKDDFKDWMKVPHKVGNFIYATNGHIAIKIKCDDSSIPETEGGNKINSIYDSISGNPLTLKIDFGNLPKNIFEPVYKILEKKKECGKCEGDGRIVCDECGSVYDCPDCEGDGYFGEDIYSDEVIGERIKEKSIVKISNSYYSPRLLTIIANELPEVGLFEYYGEHKIARIIFGSCEVLIMSMLINNYDRNTEIIELKECQ